MIQRRSFLGGILAAMMAPAIAKSGVLMPVKKIWTPTDGGLMVPNRRYSEQLVEALRDAEVKRAMQHGKLEIYSGGGALLASIPMNIAHSEERDFGRKELLSLNGAAPVLASGTAEHFVLSLEDASGFLACGKVGGDGLRINNNAMCAGDTMSIVQMGVVRDRSHRYTSAFKLPDDKTWPAIPA